MSSISKFLETAVDWTWGLPLVFLLMGGGIYLLVIGRFIPFLGFIHSLKLISGRFHHSTEKVAAGQLTHFQALSNALAATVGLGNIAGVAVAISQGGPGAIFWMWIAALIGMNTKFFECSLSVLYRGKDYRGEVQGGPMYVIEQALAKKYRVFAILFAVFGLIGCLALFQVNQLAGFAQSEFGVSPMIVGISSALFVFYVLKGGVRRIGKVSSLLVPMMALFYVGACTVILLQNSDQILGLIKLIFVEAFSGTAVGGGLLGYGVLEVMKIGVKRAAFSNEAGVGTAPMAHSNVKTAEPISEGFVAMMGPFLDTILICTMTALVILVSLGPADYANQSGIGMTLIAFQKAFPVWGVWFLGFAVLLFASTTMIGMANYFEKCWNFLFRGRFGMTESVCIFVFSSALVLGALSETHDVVNFLDIGYGLMAYPNMLATLLLAKKVKSELKKYRKKYL